MRLVIEIDLDGEAFDDDPHAEAKRVIDLAFYRMAKGVCWGRETLKRAVADNPKLYNSRGDCVGRIRVSGRKERAP